MATTSTKHPGTKPPHANRIARLRAAIRKTDASHFLVTNPKDVAYLTGFLGGDSYLLVPAEGRRKPVVVSDFRYEEELECVNGLARIHIRRRGMLDAVKQVAGDEKAKRVAIQGEHITVNQRKSIARALGGSGKIADTSGVVHQLRVIKDDAEIKHIKKAVQIQEKAFEATMESLASGQTELEVAGELESQMKRRGSSAPGFTTIVASGTTGSLPHYRPGNRKIKKNAPVLIDWGAINQGYHADMTRVVVLGKWPKVIREIYQIVLEAHERSAAALAPGKTTSEIDGIARACIEDHGYGDKFGHGLGHGLGLDGHEDPRLTHMLDPVVLEEGMVVTVEPGIYLPGVGGVRLEDDYVITRRGARNLCSMPKDLDWATR